MTQLGLAFIYEAATPFSVAMELRKIIREMEGQP